MLNSGARLQSAFRSQHLNIPGLLRLQPKPQVLINPVDAEARGISDQDRVWVESPRGRVGVWAKVTDEVMTGQVELTPGTSVHSLIGPPERDCDPDNAEMRQFAASADINGDRILTYEEVLAGIEELKGTPAQ